MSRNAPRIVSTTFEINDASRITHIACDAPRIDSTCVASNDTSPRVESTTQASSTQRNATQRNVSPIHVSTQREHDEIDRLLHMLIDAPRNEQKRIRRRLRSLNHFGGKRSKSSRYYNATIDRIDVDALIERASHEHDNETIDA